MADARTTGSGSSAASVFTADQLAGLPDPVARYFAFALEPGQPLVRDARIGQVGMFALRPGAWRPFTATERFTVHPPSFRWDARIRMAPLVSVHVRDGYERGEGATLAKLAGVVPLAATRGGPEMASGALLRYLAEAVWLPTALLPSEGITWSAVDAGTARATLTADAKTVSLDFGFDARGAIVSARGMRYRAVGKTFVLTPWAGRYRDYTRLDRMMIPMTSEVEWQLPDATYPYWRGRTVRADYIFARAAP